MSWFARLRDHGCGVCDGEGEGLRHVLGGGVSERDGLRRG